MNYIRNTKRCLAIEFLCNSQAIYLLRPLKSNKAIEAVIDLIRTRVEPITEDRTLHQDIKAITDMISDFSILDTVEKEIGALE